jgi:hypothetical protein
MKITLSSEAAKKISESAIRDSEGTKVPGFTFSYEPYVEQHYHRDSKGVEVSFTESSNKENACWNLVWLERAKVPEEAIVNIDGIELVFYPFNSKSKATEAIIDYVSNKFRVVYK